jgi:phosphoserine phosphatase
MNTRKKNNVKTIKQDEIELVVFDMDGVIIDTISSWKYIHDYFGTSNNHSVDDYLKGKIDDLEFIRRDVMLWQEKGKLITKNKLVEIVSDVKLMQGTEKCINYLKKQDIKTAIISAGLDVFADIVKEKIDIDYVFCNGVKTDKDGRLTGEGILQVQLMYKDKNIENLSKKLNIPQGKIVSVGNSCFDIPMFEVSGLGIAFNPDDNCIRDAADYIVEEKDLTKIIPILF